ncbi:MAG TPA: [Fe-Fe] hydrogenase large subunit C-terminal domain-containing protein [Candidatus Cloacimonadota bacterium]|nr:[Fe-Fe] hydrogenase large subunit C-terminal domain-containing protein [Candidatus Cloacimonadota bacterium]
MKNRTYFHALKLITENCTGCTKCVRICPTEALRVRDGKIIFDANRCIDCGKCITACNFNAIVPVTDNLKEIEKFKYRLAILSTSYAGQFPQSIGYANAKKAILKLGFDDVAEESMITMQIHKLIRDYIYTNNDIRPILSSNCPAVVRLIQVRFPDLLPHILHIEAPMSILATFYRDKICRETGLSEDEIGIFLIVPCVAQVTAVHQPEGTYKNYLDGAIAISEIYSHIINDIRDFNEQDTSYELYPKGLSWAISGMQAEDINDGVLKTMAVTGIHNVIEILLKIENQQLERYDFIVLNNCVNGCVGGILNVENPFVAAARIRDYLRKSQPCNFYNETFEKMYHHGDFNVIPLEPRSIMTLDKDIKVALEMMKKIDEIDKKLPGLDCSACGSPTCRTLAEDIVVNKADISDCVVLSRNKKKCSCHKQQNKEEV